MTSTLDLSPGSQNFVVHSGNAFQTEVDWSIDLTGYTVTSSMVSLVTGAQAYPVTTTLTDAAAGKVGLSFSAVTVPGTYGFQQSWTTGGQTRTVLSGYVEVLP